MEFRQAADLGEARDHLVEPSEILLHLPGDPTQGGVPRGLQLHVLDPPHEAGDGRSQLVGGLAGEAHPQQAAFGPLHDLEPEPREGRQESDGHDPTGHDGAELALQPVVAVVEEPDRCAPDHDGTDQSSLPAGVLERLDPRPLPGLERIPGKDFRDLLVAEPGDVPPVDGRAVQMGVEQRDVRAVHHVLDEIRPLPVEQVLRQGVGVEFGFALGGPTAALGEVQHHERVHRHQTGHDDHRDQVAPDAGPVGRALVDAAQPGADPFGNPLDPERK